MWIFFKSHMGLCSGPTVRNSGSTAGNSDLTTTLDSGADSDSGAT